MNFLLVIWNYVKQPSVFKKILVALLLILLIFSIRQCSNNAKELEYANQNYMALTDSTRIVRNKVGELESEKLVLLATKNNLETLNKNLYDELQKEHGEVKYIQKTSVSVVHDTLVVPHTITKTTDSTYNLKWVVFEKDSGWSRELEGVSVIESKKDTIFGGNTTITKDKLFLILYTGLREKDDKLEIFARTKHQGTTFQLEGALIDPENSSLFDKLRRKNNWSIGPNISVSVGLDGVVRGSAGFGVQYTLIGF